MNFVVTKRANWTPSKLSATWHKNLIKNTNSELVQSYVFINECHLVTKNRQAIELKTRTHTFALNQSVYIFFGRVSCTFALGVLEPISPNKPVRMLGVE